MSLAAAALAVHDALWSDAQAPAVAAAQNDPTAAQGGGAGAPAPQAGRAPQAPQFGALSCQERARTQTLLGESDAFLLCRGAHSDAPAACFERARWDTTLVNTQIFELCRCAESVEPVACFVRAKQTTFLTDPQITVLCSATSLHNLWPTCAPIGGYYRP